MKWLASFSITNFTGQVSILSFCTGILQTTNWFCSAFLTLFESFRTPWSDGTRTGLPSTFLPCFHHSPFRGLQSPSQLWHCIWCSCWIDVFQAPVRFIYGPQTCYLDLHALLLDVQPCVVAALEKPCFPGGSALLTYLTCSCLLPLHLLQDLHLWANNYLLFTALTKTLGNEQAPLVLPVWTASNFSPSWWRMTPSLQPLHENGHVSWAICSRSLWFV